MVSTLFNIYNKFDNVSFMNIISIDPSLISTALIVNDKIFNYTPTKNAFNKNGLNKWYKICEDYVTYRWISYDNKNDNFTDSEINK